MSARIERDLRRFERAELDRLREGSLRHRDTLDVEVDIERVQCNGACVRIEHAEVDADANARKVEHNDARLGTADFGGGEAGGRGAAGEGNDAEQRDREIARTLPPPLPLCIAALARERGR